MKKSCFEALALMKARPHSQQNYHKIVQDLTIIEYLETETRMSVWPFQVGLFAKDANQTCRWAMIDTKFGFLYTTSFRYSSQSRVPWTRCPASASAMSKPGLRQTSDLVFNEFVDFDFQSSYTRVFPVHSTESTVWRQHQDVWTASVNCFGRVETLHPTESIPPVIFTAACVRANEYLVFVRPIG